MRRVLHVAARVCAWLSALWLGLFTAWIGWQELPEVLQERHDRRHTHA